MIRGEREAGYKEGGIICVKRLSLITPAYARSLGLTTDRPLFTSLNDSELFNYRVGDTYKISGFFEPADTGSGLTVKQATTGPMGEVNVALSIVFPRPRVGIAYEEISSLSLIYGNNHWSDIKRSNWIAVVEPMGRIFREDDDVLPFNRVTDELKVKEMKVCCEWCRKEIQKEGLVLELFGNGYLFAVCTDRHYKNTIRNLVELTANARQTSPFYFEIGLNNEVVFKEI